MPKEKNREIELPSLDELFSTQEERDDAKLRRIEEILKLAASCNLTRQDISDMTDILWEDTK